MTQGEGKKEEDLGKANYIYSCIKNNPYIPLWQKLEKLYQVHNDIHYRHETRRKAKRNNWTNYWIRWNKYSDDKTIITNAPETTYNPKGQFISIECFNCSTHFNNDGRLKESITSVILPAMRKHFITGDQSEMFLTWNGQKHWIFLAGTRSWISWHAGKSPWRKPTINFKLQKVHHWILLT